MKKTAIVYWSGTGNTEAMAAAVAEGAVNAGATADVIAVADFSADRVADYDAVAFGCPDMGAEQLEEDEFEPVYEACKSVLGDKPVVLFGSYGWGGDWMDTWQDDARSAGLNLAADGVKCMEAPDEEALAACRAIGAALVQ